MRKFFSFFAMAAVVLSMASCGDSGNNPEQPDQPEQPKPVGAIKGKFSVAPGKQVYFSKGNLQATTGDKGKSWTWSFAENQWDFVGNQVANNAIKDNSKVSTNGTVDLFVWSCYKNYYGIHNSQKKTDYQAPFVDWGNNPISNGGNQPNLWRTLTIQEWGYLFQTREDAANKYGAAKVNGKPGVVLLPDEWTFPSGLKFTPGKIKGAAQYDWSKVDSKNIYDINQWQAMEENGAVFLPAAGFRYGTEVHYVESAGYYWSSTLMVYGKDGMWYLFAFISPDDILPNQSNDTPYPYGQSVRLVQDVK